MKNTERAAFKITAGDEMTTERRQKRQNPENPPEQGLWTPLRSLNMPPMAMMNCGSAKARPSFML
jgi:hypothetical protein